MFPQSPNWGSKEFFLALICLCGSVESDNNKNKNSCPRLPRDELVEDCARALLRLQVHLQKPTFANNRLHYENKTAVFVRLMDELFRPKPQIHGSSLILLKHLRRGRTK